MFICMYACSLYQCMQVYINVYEKVHELSVCIFSFRLLRLGLALLFGYSILAFNIENSDILQPLNKTFKSTKFNNMNSLFMFNT